MAMSFVCPRFGPNGEDFCFAVFLASRHATSGNTWAVQRQGLVKAVNHTVAWSATKPRKKPRSHHDLDFGGLGRRLPVLTRRQPISSRKFLQARQQSQSSAPSYGANGDATNSSNGSDFSALLIDCKS
jgi:hypothetical protein